jgi:hypothetical protein
MTTMTNLKLPLLAAALAGSLASLSCGGGGSDAPNAYVTSTLGSAPTGHCNIMEPEDTLFVVLGSPTSPVADGSNYEGSPVSVACQVTSTGTDTYDVNAQVTQGTINGFTFQGTLTSSPAVQTGFSASFTSNAGSYASTTCTIQLQQGATATNPSITAGRVWATLSCPAITEAENNDTCAGQATFILQNCSD